MPPVEATDGIFIPFYEMNNKHFAKDKHVPAKVLF